MTAETPPAAPKDSGSGLQLLLEIGPLALYFIVFTMVNGEIIDRLLIATGAFFVAMIAAMLVGYRKSGKVTTLQVVSVVLVAVSGLISYVTRDPAFIKMKPTFFYVLGAAILGWGLVMKKNLLKMLLGASFPGLSEEGWHKLTRNWALFFLALAILNELVWRNSSTSFWLGFKLWGFVPLSFIFVFAQMPMLMRHGFDAGQKE